MPKGLPDSFWGAFDVFEDVWYKVSMIEITLYPFADAPPFLRNVSTNGGDEDWVASSETRLDELAQEMYLPRANILDEYFIEDEDLWVYIGSHS